MFIVAGENPQPTALNDSPVTKNSLKFTQFQAKGLPSPQSSMTIYT